MSIRKESDVKNHLFRRTRPQIHLIPSASQPDAAEFSAVEQPKPAVIPADGILEHVPKEFEALRSFLVSESSATSKNGQE